MELNIKGGEKDMEKSMELMRLKIRGIAFLVMMGLAVAIVLLFILFWIWNLEYFESILSILVLFILIALAVFIPWSEMGRKDKVIMFIILIVWGCLVLLSSSWIQIKMILLFPAIMGIYYSRKIADRIHLKRENDNEGTDP